MLALVEVDAVELERHMHFVKYYGNTSSAGGVGITVEFENHGDDRTMAEGGILLGSYIVVRRPKKCHQLEPKARFLSTRWMTKILLSA